MTVRARIDGFDIWRASLLLLGPVVHGAPSTVGDRILWMEILVQFSHLFRMEAFLAVAGFLMIYLDGPARPGWLTIRLRQLLLPMITIWILFNIPLTVFLHMWDGSDINTLDPLHLWFLFDLAAATIFIWLLGRHWLEIEPRKQLSWFACWLGTAIGARILLYKLHSGNPFADILTGLPYYTCFFVAGAVVAANPNLTQRLRTTRFWWLGLPVLAAGLCLFIAGYSLLIDPDRSEHHFLFRLIYTVIGVICATGMTFTIFSTALRLQHQHPLMGYLNRSAYTVYLTHMTIVVVLAKIFSSLTINSSLQFIILVPLTLVLCWIFHRHVVERWPIAALLFNGASLSHGHWLIRRRDLMMAQLAPR
jgi:fucose 4-O-acetylase-like acetyltransferase